MTTTEKRQELEKEVVGLEKQIEKQQERVDKYLKKDDLEKAEREQKKLADLSVQADVRRQRIGQLLQDEQAEAQADKRARLNERITRTDEIQVAIDGNARAFALAQDLYMKLDNRMSGLWEDHGQQTEDGFHAYVDRTCEEIKQATPRLDFEEKACIASLLAATVNERADLENELRPPKEPTPLQVEAARRQKDLEEKGSVREADYPLFEASLEPPGGRGKPRQPDDPRDSIAPPEVWVEEVQRP